MHRSAVRHRVWQHGLAVELQRRRFSLTHNGSPAPADSGPRFWTKGEPLWVIMGFVYLCQ